MANCAPGECENDPKYTTPVKLKPYPGGSEGGHEFVTDLPETGGAGIEYVLMDDLSDCETYRGTFVWNEDCGGWIQTSGSGGGAIERYTFEQTATGWRAKRNNTVIFTYVDKDTIDSYENTADGFQIARNGVVIFTHTDGGGGDCKEYTITSTADGWVFKEDGVTKFTYTEPANDPSDGTYFTSGTLTTAITGTTTVAASSVTGLTLADVVIGETLIYDEAGTVGRVTAVNGTNLTVETITTAPGERRGTRLGAVDDYTDLPATCAAAVALGWQTPLAGDFAYVRTDTSHDSHLTEWVISSIDSSCNITWAYSHTLNAGNYVLDIYKYGDYPSGSPIPKNPDGSVTLPKDENTKYDFENLMDGSDIIGWRVKDHETGTVLYTYTDLNDNDTYSFEDVTVSGSVVGWRVKDKSGTVIYTYTDLNDKSDGTYFTSATLDTDITDQTTVAASTVTGLTLADVVVGETLIYDGDGTVGVVTAVSGTDLTVDTITVAGSGDASSYVYKTTGTLDTTVDNTVNLALSTLSNSAGTTPTASDIIIGKTLAWDADGTVALAVAISGTDVTFRTITASGSGGGSISYLVDKNGDAVKSAMYKLIQSGKADTPNSNDYGFVQVAKNAIIPFHKISGDFENGSTQGTFKVPDGMRIEVTLNMTIDTKSISGTANPTNIRAFLYNVTDGVYCKGDSNEQIPAAYSYSGEYGTTAYAQAPYVMARNVVIQWENKTGHTVDVGFRVCNFTNDNSGLPVTFRTDATAMTAKEIGRYVDPIKYLDNSEGLQDTPVGNIISYMGNNVPRHYLACDGTIYNIGDYPALEAHFIEEFGRVNYFGGNGTTTWAVPDLQGEFLRGTGTNSHANAALGRTEGSGANVGVHQEATAVEEIWRFAGNLYFDNKSTDKTQNMDAIKASSGTRWHITGASQETDAQPNNLFTSRPTNTSVKYCIKYESTMQVIIGSEQYKVEASLTDGGSKTWSNGGQNNSGQICVPNLLNGDSQMIDTTNKCFVAPVTGWYEITAFMTMSTKQGGKSAWIIAFLMNDNNRKLIQTPLTPRNPGNAAYDSILDQMECSGTVHLEKGDQVQIGAWAQDSDLRFGNNARASMVLLTSSVDINEINLIAADDVYSTDEQLVGSYLGKPMYKKTYPVGSSSGLSISSTAWTSSGITVPSDLDAVIKAEGHASQGRATTNNGAFPILIHADNGATTFQLTAARDGNSCSIFYFTVWYTKTSDTAGSAPNKNSLLLTRPDLWTPGTEYDFGGGLYGYRRTGTITAAANTEYNITPIIPSTTTAKIISYGGWVAYNNNTASQMQLGYNQAQSAGDSYSAAFYVNANGVSLTSSTTVARTNAPYDVWVTYTK